MTSQPPDPDDLVDALAQAAFATMAVLSKVSADNDLSLTQLRVLAILRDRRLTMRALADYLGLEKSTMTGLVDRAQKRGLLQRAPNDRDGRAVDVFLTPAGTMMAEQGAADIRRSLLPMTGQLGPADRRRLQDLLTRIVDPREP
jgi:DNA-binding MarR family transcriptional regulator